MASNTLSLENDDQPLTPECQEDAELIAKAVAAYENMTGKCNRCGDVLHVTDMNVMGARYYCIPCTAEIEDYL